jgi:hypothetical protein
MTRDCLSDGMVYLELAGPLQNLVMVVMTTDKHDALVCQFSQMLFKCIQGQMLEPLFHRRSTWLTLTAPT